LLAVILLISCQREEPVSPASEKIYSYVYHGSYSISDIHLYAGQKGEIKTVTEAEVQKFFLASFDHLGIQKIVIDLEKDSLYEVSSNLKQAYKIAVKNDSVFYLNRGEGKQPLFGGVLNGDRDSYSYCQCFYFYRYQDEYTRVTSSGSVLGYLTYEDNFAMENLKYIGEDYSFTSPEEMKNKNDAVCWVNVQYRLNKVQNKVRR